MTVQRDPRLQTDRVTPFEREGYCMSIQRKLPVETPRAWICRANENLGVAEREMQSVLNEYITAGRYPGDITFESIGDAKAREAMSIAPRIRGMVIAKLATERH